MRARALPAALLALAWASPARAADSEVTSDTAAQAYDVRSPTGETILARRRLTTTLAVGVYDMLDAAPGDPWAPQLSFRARLRYDADTSVGGGTVDPGNPYALVPGASQGLVDLMYGYLEGRRFLHGWLGFRLGRQYVTDALGWWSFDGGEVNVTTPFYVKAEAYGGLEQRGGMPLGTSRYESDGVWRGNRSGYDPSLYPQFQPANIAPAIGVALESVGVSFVHGRLSYRRVYDTGDVNTTEFASGLYPAATTGGARISSERLGYAVDASLPDVGGAKAGVVYDLYASAVTSAYGSLDAYLGKHLTIGADYDYYVPTFDGDSIWNFFAGEPMNDVGVHASLDVTDQVEVAAGGHARVYTVQTAQLQPASLPYPLSTPGLFPSNGHPFDEGGTVSARYRTGATLVSLHGAGNWGDEGDRVGADVSAERVFEGRFVTHVRTGVWQWTDKLRPDRDATSVNYVLGLGYRFARQAQTMFEWEHDMNRLAGQRLRLMVWLQVAVGK